MTTKEQSEDKRAASKYVLDFYGPNDSRAYEQDHLDLFFRWLRAWPRR